MRIKEGEEIPWYYGIAWRNHAAREAVCFILPFNWIFRGIRECLAILKFPKYSKLEQMEIKAAHYYKAEYDRKLNELEKGIEQRVIAAIDETLALILPEEEK